ncbi:E3 ubiquitin/ISG15 ligase TRIM25 [Amia ocellicauda]|uniref:E3 ubiquitin/ISG15 ligase TRIM25 n=1 Tax=Amia ocellicauda TaxID=2972642 RepID=UPI0034648EED
MSHFRSHFQFCILLRELYPCLILTMAERKLELISSEILICSIFEALLKEPATLACGHSFCLGCIQGSWAKAEEAEAVSCPQCRETFSTRPVLCRNTVLAEVVGRFRMTDVSSPEGQSAAPAKPQYGPCDFCADSIQRAVKSCLVCLASFCETHIQTHHEKAPLKKHTVVSPVLDFQDQLCSHHERPLELFCTDDEICICVLCARDQHKLHNTVTERQEKQKQMGQMKADMQLQIEDRQKDVKELKQARESLLKSEDIELGRLSTSLRS